MAISSLSWEITQPVPLVEAEKAEAKIGTGCRPAPATKKLWRSDWRREA